MSRKHYLMLKRPTQRKNTHKEKENISLKNKKTEIISLSRIYCKSIPIKPRYDKLI